MRGAVVVAVVIAAVAPSARAEPAQGKKKSKLAPAQCQAKADALKTFLDACAEQEGHTTPCKDCTLAPLPVAKGKSPRYPAVTVRVTNGGINVAGEGNVPLPAGDDGRVANVLAMINATGTMAFLKGNPNAAARGIVIGVAPDAPWELVVTATAAAARSGERVWLLFRPDDSKITPPPPSRLSREFDLAKEKTDWPARRSDLFFAAVKKEIAPCPAVKEALGASAGQSPNRRVTYLADKLPPVIRACGCDPDPASLATLAYEGIESAAVAVEVPFATGASDKAVDVAFARGTRWDAAYAAVIEKAEAAKGQPLRLRVEGAAKPKR